MKLFLVYYVRKLTNRQFVNASHLNKGLLKQIYCLISELCATQFVTEQMFCQGGQWKANRLSYQKGLPLGFEPSKDREDGGRDY